MGRKPIKRPKYYLMFCIGNGYLQDFSDFMVPMLELLTQLSRLNSSALQNIPEEVREHVKLLLNVAPAVRPDADQMTKVSSWKIKQLKKRGEVVLGL